MNDKDRDAVPWPAATPVSLDDNRRRRRRARRLLDYSGRMHEHRRRQLPPGKDPIMAGDPVSTSDVPAVLSRDDGAWFWAADQVAADPARHP